MVSWRENELRYQQPTQRGSGMQMEEKKLRSSLELKRDTKTNGLIMMEWH